MRGTPGGLLASFETPEKSFPLRSKRADAAIPPSEPLDDDETPSTTPTAKSAAAARAAATPSASRFLRLLERPPEEEDGEIAASRARWASLAAPRGTCEGRRRSIENKMRKRVIGGERDFFLFPSFFSLFPSFFSLFPSFFSLFPSFFSLFVSFFSLCLRPSRSLIINHFDYFCGLELQVYKGEERYQEKKKEPESKRSFIIENGKSKRQRKK